jgi:hypothetical protein
LALLAKVRRRFSFPQDTSLNFLTDLSIVVRHTFKLVDGRSSEPADVKSRVAAIVDVQGIQVDDVRAGGKITPPSRLGYRFSGLGTL